MATLSAMRSRIADDLNRSDLTSQINTAINRAISYYGKERFYFNEDKTTFSTVANQKSYGTADSVPSLLLQIDVLKISINSADYVLTPKTYAEIQAMDISSYAGYPMYYAYFQEKIWLYPIPNGAYTVTLSYQKGYADLSADADTNDFTEEAEDLIESRARWWLYTRVIKDVEEAAIAEKEEMKALAALREKTEKRLDNNAAIVSTEF